MKNYEVKLIRKAAKDVPAMYAVVPLGLKSTPENTVGLLMKYRNTRTEKHPWKAFTGVGENVTFIGAFYPGVRDGGKLGAMAASC